MPFILSILLQPDQIGMLSPKNPNLLNKHSNVIEEESAIKSSALISTFSEVLTPMKGFSIIKPSILKLLDILYIKADKKVHDEFLNNLKQFENFLSFEYERLNANKINITSNNEIEKYFFESLIPVLSRYVNKVLLDSIAAGHKDRRDNSIIERIVKLAQGILQNIHLKLSSSTIHYCRKIMHHYLEDDVIQELFKKIENANEIVDNSKFSIVI